MIKIRSNVKMLIAKEEAKEMRTIPASEIARDARLSENTVRNLALGRTRRIDVHVLEKVLWYFHERGRDYGLDDLFDVEIVK